MNGDTQLSMNKIDHLRNKIASSYGKGINPKELGDVALELLLIRNEIHHKLDEETTFKQKEEMKKTIEELHDLERVIVSMYMLQGMKATNEPMSKYSFTDYFTRHYSIPRKLRTV